MKKGWKIIISIVMVAVLLGAVFMGVGVLTGADMARIYSTLDDRFMITQYYQWLQDTIAAYRAVL